MLSNNNNNRRIRRRRWEKAYHSQSYHSNANTTNTTSTTTTANAKATTTTTNDDLRLPDGIIIGIGTISSISININSTSSNTNVINSIVTHRANLKHSSLWSYLRRSLNNHLNDNDNDDDDDDNDDDDDGDNDDNDNNDDDNGIDDNDDNDNDNNDGVISVISGLESMNNDTIGTYDANDAIDGNDAYDAYDTSELLGLLDDIDANITIHSEGMNAALSAYYILKGITRGTTVGYVGTILHGNDENSIDINDEKMVIENFVNGTTMIPDAYDNDTNTNGAIDIQLASRRSDNSDDCTSRIINVINTNASANTSANANANASTNTNTNASTNATANTAANNDSTIDIDHRHHHNNNNDNNDDNDDNDGIELDTKGSIFSSDFTSPEINASLMCASYWMLSTKEFLTSYGGYESLVTLCNMSTKLSKCLVINLSADISFTKNKESLSMIIPHTDFLFITVKGIINYVYMLTITLTITITITNTITLLT